MTVMIPEAISAGESALGASSEAGSVAGSARSSGGNLSPAIKKSTGVDTRKSHKITTLGQGRSSKKSTRKSGGIRPFGTPKGRVQRSAHGIVIAEFIACIIMTGVTPVMTRKAEDGHLYRSNDFIRLTAVCLVFFVLALMSNTVKLSRVSAAFGGLITVGLLFNSTQMFKQLGVIFSNAQKQGSNLASAKAGDAKIDLASYTPTGVTKPNLAQLVDDTGFSVNATPTGSAAPTTGEVSA